MSRARLGPLLQHFSELEDDREPWRVMCPLKEVPAAGDMRDDRLMRRFRRHCVWGEHTSTSCGGSRGSITAFRASSGCASWSTGSTRLCSGAASSSGWRRCGPTGHEFIANSGKTARRTHDYRKGLEALHALSAYATWARLTLAQLSVPEKSNEITAIPDLLDRFAETDQLAGALVTIDSLGLSGRDRRQDRRPQGR
jgi:hypothetical protein